MKLLKLFLLGLIVCLSTTGCWLVAAGAGAEAGYVASQDDRSAKETLSDQYVTTAVKTKLIATSKVPAMDINVDTFKGNVTLRGALRSQEQVDRALEAARTVSGVKSVQSKLTVVY